MQGTPSKSLHVPCCHQEWEEGCPPGRAVMTSCLERKGGREGLGLGCWAPVNITCFPGTWTVTVCHTRAQPKEQWQPRRFSWAPGGPGTLRGVGHGEHLGLSACRGQGCWVTGLACPLCPLASGEAEVMSSLGLLEPGGPGTAAWHRGAPGAGQKGKQPLRVLPVLEAQLRAGGTSVLTPSTSRQATGPAKWP